MASFNDGIITRPSTHSVDQTVEKLSAILKAKGIAIFALIDHSGEAEKAGLTMHPTKLLIFGNPKAGTPLMIAAPGNALDLPLKILVLGRPGRQGLGLVQQPCVLQTRHGLPAELLKNIAVVETLAIAAAE